MAPASNSALAGLLAPAAAGTGHRERILAGMIAAVVERGYAATTITDVVRHARVSRRTFYEHFEDKEACFLAAYDAVADAILGAIEGAAAEHEEPRERIVAGVRAYLRGLALEPEIARVFTVEVLSAGPHALRRRRGVLRRFAASLRDQVDAAVAAGAPGRRISDATALALAGAIHELVLEALEEERGAELPELEGDIADLVAAAVIAPRSAGGRRPGERQPRH
jgi:AcrR family transcriptional regulator